MKRFFDKIYLLIICVVVIALSVSLFALPDRKFSDKENRTLMSAPVFNSESVISGEYTKKLASYFADQFPARDVFVAFKAYAELLQGKGENNGIIYTDEGILIPRDEIKDDRLYENLDIISEFEKSIKIDVAVAALPRAVDVFSEFLPKTYPNNDNKVIWNKFNNAVNDLNLTATNVYDLLCESNAYYHTDHHYTSRGAYLTYKALGENLGYTPYDEAYFDIQTVDRSFCGTSMRTSGFYLSKKDEITLYRYDGDNSYSVIADGKTIDLYNFSKLGTTDKYAVFLDGNHARVDIEKGSGRERLVIIRDSFADSLAPFLAMHYDIILIDLRYYNESVIELVEQENISKVLILENISELATAKNISYLKMK